MTRRFLQDALDLAREAVGQTSPNPAVGCVIVQGGVVAGRAFHTYAGVKHAEVLALEQAGVRARGATAYISLEPCSHQGRTGPCVDALIQAGISRVVVPGLDPNPQVSGQGLERLRAAGVDVEIVPDLAEAAEAINRPFYHFMRTGLPLVTLKAALTLDGKIAAPEDNQGWITSERARAHVQIIRHRHDAIMTGINTVVSDDCLLTDRSGLPRSRPLLRIILDSLLRLPTDRKMITSRQGDVLVVCTSAASADRRRALEDEGVEVVVADGPDGRTDLPSVVRLLAARQYVSLMIEAGSRVNWAALESGIVDRVYFYYAPKILGGTQSLSVAGGRGRRRRSDAIRLHGVVVHSIPPDEFAIEASLMPDSRL